ncbi:hypothetical protein NDI56_15875 [Haloarcula sp. S1CR25-12]|uniref:Halobacterial output domain-containing protein n=1 Tax=Haloarcula saliterrae TaxID=2950534 RepID=A0ABU2FF70_9EURY|nr:hypothetical protein [Haloarcula sp. S1CR25-12]MDS0260884.1 hypothetical protein [Haloarcula sp. S1CR25-12]
MAEIKHNVVDGTDWGRIERPDDDVCMRLLAAVATEYQLGDDDVTDDTGSLIDSSVLDLAYIIRRGTVAEPNYSDGQIVVATGKTHPFADGDGRLTVCVRADRDTHEIESVEVSAYLY